MRRLPSRRAHARTRLRPGPGCRSRLPLPAFAGTRHVDAKVAIEPQAKVDTALRPEIVWHETNSADASGWQLELSGAAISSRVDSLRASYLGDRARLHV